MLLHTPHSTLVGLFPTSSCSSCTSIRHCQPPQGSAVISLSLLSLRKQNAVFLTKIFTSSNSGAIRRSAYLYLSSRVDNVISEVPSGLQLFTNHLHAPTSLLLFRLLGLCSPRPPPDTLSDNRPPPGRVLARAARRAAHHSCFGASRITADECPPSCASLFLSGFEFCVGFNKHWDPQQEEDPRR